MAVTQPRGRAAVSDEGPKRLTLDLPMLSIEVRQPEMRMPHLEMSRLPMPHISRQELGHYVDVVRTFLPPPERMAYYGALGALAVFGVVDWPIAAAIGAGTIIAQRQRRRQPPMLSTPRATQASTTASATRTRATQASTTASGTRTRAAQASTTASGTRTRATRARTAQAAETPEQEAAPSKPATTRSRVATGTRGTTTTRRKSE
jgi:hypothetical protein